MRNGKHVPVPESSDGIRRRYRVALDPKRFEFPRRRLNHKVEWYLDGKAAVARPTIGVYAMAMFAEYLMHQVRYGRLGQSDSIREVTEFFAATRRALQNVLSTYSIRKVLDRKSRDSLRAVVENLVLLARTAYEAMKVASLAHRCPACGGASLRASDAMLLEAILVEQSRNGTIPETSALYRDTRLTPTTGM